ncbi:GTPase HflX [Limnobacter litoralis]|uniref:GTPase HflX n=1 Tax=Limnobacter litoralis TaxID=481366 RepID=A0ABQ5YYF6_9BURK|nr:GTPase HflX [Limnobacter litoralis]GLR27739.1 GTPase HflX [Limnobacter litoralis]
MTRSVLVALDLGQFEFAESLDELALLAKSAGAEIVGSFSSKRRSPDPATFIGSGKAAEIADFCAASEVELVIFNHALSPAQQRNLEGALKVRVIDRTGLILDIFAIRAQSFEGKLQVELAQLQYLASRLVRSRSDLTGQQGGIGMRGPGETQLETDRRLIGVKVKQLKARLEKLRKQRQTQRRQRERRGQFTVAIVGYTNAGKSTLFNAVASSKAYAADQLFATLDTTSRRVYLAEGVDMVLSDTVGFIRDLSHSLIEAFKATLESTVQADLLLHVVDASAPNRHSQIEEVNMVLQEVDAQEVQQILIWNKIDACERDVAVERDQDGKISSVSVSARYGLGLPELRQCLTELASEFYLRNKAKSVLPT